MMRKIGMEEYKSIVLDVLVKIDTICRKNGLKYMLMYGTLIGAVRHKGFIPWDDDIDIAMPREDYYKLAEIIGKNDFGINFLTIDNCPDTIYPYGKICDTRTVVKEKNFKQVSGYGAFVDVFPLDYMPDDQAERIKYCKKCRSLIIWITHSSRTGYAHSGSLKTNLSRALAFYIGKAINTQRLIRKLDGLLKRFNLENGKTSYLGLPWGYYADKLYPASMLEELTEVEFEGHRFFAPKEYDKVLRMRYGDYMKLPPENERVYLHSLNCTIRDPE